ncbi:MAG: hypothetical protein B6D56_05280 [Candidatus Omnitrophica bacterium 4484_70.1]|nr:MAG: hypothetical protein B6D56_05280 [Candidatus Omnitrophica bacterium 4484_70.1]
MKIYKIFPLFFSLLFVFTEFSQSKEKILVLDEKKAVKIALKRNWDILIKDEKLKEAKAQILKTWSALFPQISGFASYQKYNNHPFITYENNQGYGINADQIIFNLEIFNTIRKASSFFKSAKEEKREQLNAVIFEVKKAFLYSLIAQKSLEVTQNALNLARKYLKTTKIRFENGEASDYDVLRAEVEVKNLEYKFLKAKSAYETSLNYLKLLLGINLQEKLKIKGKVEFKRFRKDFSCLVKSALSRRPLIKAIEFKEESLKHNLRAVKSEFLSSLVLNFQDIANEKEVFAFNRGKYEDYWILTLRLNFPIFEGGLRFFKLKEAKAQLKQIKLLKGKTISGIKIEIKNALLNLESAKKEVEATQSNVKDANRMYEIIYKRYLEGEASYLDILDARNTLLASQLNNLQTLFDYNLSLLKLKYFTGENLEKLGGNL